jgi:hypothetical protein
VRNREQNFFCGLLVNLIVDDEVLGYVIDE